jgi:tRNA-dihydrouridine synthase
MAPKSIRDVARENNKNLPVIPQLLTNDSAVFKILEKTLHDEGYEEINLNLGCPSGTVTSKGRGSGQLKDTDALKKFLDTIFTQQETAISIKTRIGFSSPREMETLLPIFNAYPLKELLVHPRIREDYYKGSIHLDVFQDIVEKAVAPLCYNGDLFTAEQIKQFTHDFPSIKRIMLGRGIVSNPGLLKEYKTGIKSEAATFQQFHDSLLSQYSTILFGERNILFKMKDCWKIWRLNFLTNPQGIKKIQKSQNISAYQSAVDSLIQASIS